MDDKEREYLRMRMEREREIAERATCPFAASIHAELARLYEERLNPPGRVVQMPRRRRMAAAN